MGAAFFFGFTAPIWVPIAVVLWIIYKVTGTEPQVVIETVVASIQQWAAEHPEIIQKISDLISDAFEILANILN